MMQAFLQAIREAPDDDAPRLIFADWLDDNGDPDRAEFIRTQIARARLPADDDRQAELAAREAHLERFDWARALSPCLDRPFIRGFPDHVGFPRLRSLPETVSAAGLAALTDALDRVPARTFSAPLLGCYHTHFSWVNRTVFPAEGESGLEGMANWPGLQRLTGLEVRESRGEQAQGDFTSGLRSLADSPFAVGLERLKLGPCWFEPAGLHAVASSPHLPNLADLDLSYGSWEVGVPAIEALMLTDLRLRLRSLNCAWSPIHPSTVRGFIEVAPLRELRFGPVTGDDANGRMRGLNLGPLLGAPGLASLRRLGLTGEDHGFDTDEMPNCADDMVTLPDLRELLASPLLANLEELELSGILLGDEGAAALADAPLARNLIALKLDLCGLTGAGLAALRPLLAEGRLRRLSLSHNPFEKADAANLASWPELRRLHELNLNFFNHLEDAGEAVLTASPHRHPYLKLS